MLENRTGQCIPEGREIRKRADDVAARGDDLLVSFGCVLDVQQLHTVTKERCFASFDLIPPAFLRGFPIHWKHGTPSVGDPIPWGRIFARVRAFDHPIIINPEVHHKNEVGETIGWGMVGGGG